MKPGALILTINGGSSSIKFALFETAPTLRRLLVGSIERIGDAVACLSTQSETAARISRPVRAPDHATAVDVLMEWIARHPGAAALTAAGHRIVHGGPRHWVPQLITPSLVADLQQLIPFDPQHLPAEIRLIEALQRRFPKLPQVACFDTAFHHDLPRVAQMLAIPRRYESLGLRRYGFHGLSYAFLMEELERLAGAAAQGRVVLAHLGNGASMAAVHGGKAVDTSMGFTPASGLPMSTRSGDLDPGLVGYLVRTEQLSVDQFDRMVNFESGLLGVSGTHSDMRELLKHEAQDPRAAEAIALFCYQARKCIGAFAAALGGLDTLVFSGGMGENASPIRERICAGLGFLGIELDAHRNAQAAAVISTDTSRTTVRVIPTDEERRIAKSVADLLSRATTMES